MRKKKTNKLLKVLLILVCLFGLVLGVYFIPAVKSRVDWNWYELKSKIFYYFNPPGEDNFTPGQQTEIAEIVQMSQTAAVLAATDTPEPTITPTNFISPTPTQTPSPTAPTSTSIPESVRFAGSGA